VGSTTSIVQPHKGGPVEGTVTRHAPAAQSPTGESGGASGVTYMTTVSKIGEREWKRHTDKVLLDDRVIESYLVIH